MQSEGRFIGLVIAIAGVALIAVLAMVVVGMSGSYGTTEISDNKARIETDGRLSLTWMNKVFYDIHREGDVVVVGSLISERHPLCGPGCTIEIPFGILEKLVVTENANGSLTVEWPGGYWKY